MLALHEIDTDEMSVSWRDFTTVAANYHATIVRDRDDFKSGIGS